MLQQTMISTNAATDYLTNNPRSPYGAPHITQWGTTHDTTYEIGKDTTTSYPEQMDETLIVDGKCEDNGESTQQNIIYESMSIERLEDAHRKAMDIEDGICMDDGAGAMDCSVTRERMYADRLRRAYKHKWKLENVRDHKSDAHATLTTENEWKRRRIRDTSRPDPQLPQRIPIPTHAIPTTDPTHSTSISTHPTLTPPNLNPTHSLHHITPHASHLIPTQSHPNQS